METIAIAVPDMRSGAASRAQISRQVITPAKPKPNRTESWNSVAAPAKTPKDTLAQLVAWFRAAGESPELKEKLGALGLSPNVSCGAEHGAELSQQYERYGTAIRASNIKAD